MSIEHSLARRGAEKLWHLLHRDLDVSPPEDLEAVADEHARIYVEFMNKHAAVGAD